MINLSQVTLVAVSSVRIEQTVKALEYSSQEIEFGSIKFISDIQPQNLSSKISFNKVDKISNIDEWNYFIIYKLPTYINTDYCILIHDNGFIVNPKNWRDEFLQYDYIGAPWPLPHPNDPHGYRDINKELIRVGNSVSLRSKKLLDLPIQQNFEWKPFYGYTNEDGFICCHYRHKYLEAGCKFADINVAKYFSHEIPIPEIEGIEPFAFHNYIGLNTRYPRL